jgi:flavin reductase (DIM6/NTAB) family NADH-FMN oxidoreductase RutF
MAGKVDKSLLRECFGSFMTGVTVITTKNNGCPIGFTANSFTSVSLEPPLLLICIDNASENLNTFIDGQGFGVNILAYDQQELSNRFATPVKERFDGIKWVETETGNPELADCATFFDCALEQNHLAGDHTILIGRVINCRANAKNVLGYHRGGYFTIEKRP